jgi:hypothetical protein
MIIIHIIGLHPMLKDVSLSGKKGNNKLIIK